MSEVTDGQSLLDKALDELIQVLETTENRINALTARLNTARATSGKVFGFIKLKNYNLHEGLEIVFEVRVRGVAGSSRYRGRINKILVKNHSAVLEVQMIKMLNGTPQLTYDLRNFYMEDTTVLSVRPLGENVDRSLVTPKEDKDA